jgi:hypothetical protein
MSYKYVVVWKNRKGNQFHQYFKTYENADKFCKTFTPTLNIYELVEKMEFCFKKEDGICQRVGCNNVAGVLFPSIDLPRQLCLGCAVKHKRPFL